MELKIPQLHNFSRSLKEEASEETGCQSEPEWEIAVQRRDDIAWSVVLSYLISTNYRNRDQDDFARRLKQLTGTEKNLKLVKKSIKSFNPFRNRYSCIYDETMKQVVKDFKKKLNWNSLSRVRDKMKAVSKALGCSIVSIWKDENIPKSRIYSKNADQYQDIIKLYSCDSTGEENEKVETIYNFMLNYQLGLKMKNAALLYFLKEAKLFRKEIRSIKSTVKNGKHFLITLLSGKCRNIIPKLYKSAYVISKIAEAGYETDPRTKDADGLSALYHALVLGNAKTLYVLYYFAANNCFQSECSYRNPDSSIVNNLLEMKEMLRDDLAKSENLKHHSNHDDLKKAYDDLFRLNKFLVEINCKIIKIKNKFNNEIIEERVFEASKRRDILVSVLDTYQEFFHAVDHGNTNISPLYDYVMFKNYYNSIDMVTAKIFFDNIIFLKERLVLADKDQFSAMESSFLFSVMHHVVFDTINLSNISKSFDPLITGDVNSLYILPLIRRQENMRIIEIFNKNLQDTTVNKSNVVTCIPKNEIFGILNSYPIVKDWILLNRLNGYLNIARKLKVKDVKSVLVIERVLQVIGECLKSKKDNKNSCLKYLSFTVPTEVSRILFRIRNKLSNLKSHAFMSKAKYETNFSLFRSIQKEILLMQSHLKPIFEIQNLRGYIFLLKLFHEQLTKIRELPNLYPLNLLKEIGTNFKKLLLNLRYRYSLTRYEMLEKNSPGSEKDISNNTDRLEYWENKKTYLLGKMENLESQYDEAHFPTILSALKRIKHCYKNTDSENELDCIMSIFLTECKNSISMFIPSRRKSMVKSLKEVRNVERFLKILKGFYFLSNEEKDEIRQQIPNTIKQSVDFKEKLIKSIKEGIFLKIDKEDFNISYLSNSKKNLIFDLYQDESPNALTVLETPDPINELEEIFSTNSVHKKKYETLCEIMQFSDRLKKILGRIVAGKEMHGNSLYNLLTRIQLMKKFLIDENKEIFNLWERAERETLREHIVDKIVWYYLRDDELRAAVEMLLFDCMNMYKNRRSIENPWIKSSKFYCGLNLRNVLSHGSPLLECLCKLLDPEDLPSDMIKKIVRLIEGENAIQAILELFEKVDNDFPKLLTIINSEEKDEYIGLRNRIWKCGEWKTYILLLPYN